MPAEEISTGNQQDTAQAEVAHHWLDIFYRLLVSPIKTFAIISNPVLYSSDFSAVLGAMLTVVIAALADSCVGITSFSLDGLISNAFLSLLSDLFFFADFNDVFAIISGSNESKRTHTYLFGCHRLVFCAISAESTGCLFF